MQFLETPIFTRQVLALLDDSEYAALQSALVIDPQAGDLIPGTGGLRKLRWGQATRAGGKRGGIRVIYYWQRARSAVYMLLAYSKRDRDDMTTREKRLLKRLVSEEFK